MYTLKIHWSRFEGNELADETTLFIPADAVQVHGEVVGDGPMKAWPEGSYDDYRSVSLTVPPAGGTAATIKQAGRLICVDRAGSLAHTYLASKAWLLGPDGRTIERVAP